MDKRLSIETVLKPRSPEESGTRDVAAIMLKLLVETATSVLEEERWQQPNVGHATHAITTAGRRAARFTRM